jgi:DNA-binding XRE family transcriptional regulator
VETAAYVRINRKRLGITQSTLANRLGVARTTIVAIERGQRKLRENELIALKAIGFPDEALDSEPAESEQGDERWMWLNKDERILIRAFRGGRIEKVLRLCLAHKDAVLATMQLDEDNDG